MTRFVAGEWNAICDICGFEFKASELVENWKGQRVCRKDFETRHPQEFVRPRRQEQLPAWTKPDTDDDVAIRLLDAPVTASPIDASLTTTIIRVNATVDSTSHVVLPDANDAVYKGIGVRLCIQNLEPGSYSFGVWDATGPRATVLNGTVVYFRNVPSQNLWIKE